MTESCLPYEASPATCPFAPGNGTCADGTDPTFYYADTVYGLYPSIMIIGEFSDLWQS